MSDTDFRQDIEVPETLLKKRKQNEKAREERLEKAAAAKKVHFALSPPLCDAYVSWNGY
jgi:hypothetical protein